MIIIINTFFIIFHYTSLALITNVTQSTKDLDFNDITKILKTVVRLGPVDISGSIGSQHCKAVTLYGRIYNHKERFGSFI